MILTDKELLKACRGYIATAQFVAEMEYSEPESEMYADPRALEVMNETANILSAIDDALSTRH